MTISKETELMNSIIVFFHRCEEEGDYNALFEMGFGASEVRALSSLSTADALRLASTKSHFLKITLNRDIYWRMIDYILREREKETILEELIRCDAPFAMLRSLTGMNSKQFKLKRSQLGLPALQAGRPRRPSLEAEKSVWAKLNQLPAHITDLGAQQFLEIFYQLDRQIPLRTIWNLYQEWELDGALTQLQET